MPSNMRWFELADRFQHLALVTVLPDVGLLTSSSTFSSYFTDALLEKCGLNLSLSSPQMLKSRWRVVAELAGASLDSASGEPLACWLAALEKRRPELKRQALVLHESESLIRLACQASAEYCCVLAEGEQQKITPYEHVSAENRVERPDATLRVENPNDSAEENQLRATAVASTGDQQNRSMLVAQFLSACNQSGLRVFKNHIWRAVGHRTGRQFQYWQSRHTKATEQDHRNFTRILGNSPEEFRNNLTRRGIEITNT